MTPEELEAERLRQEAEAQRIAQEAEAQRLAEEAARQKAAANNPMTQPTDLIGQQGQQETGMDTDPLLMGGLGLGGGFVASQTGGAPATSQVLSSFAQKVAAQDAATRAAQRAAVNPAIIGQNLPRGIGGLGSSALTMAATPTLMGDATLDSAYKYAVSQGEDPAAAAARLGVEDTSILGLDKSNRKVATVDGRGVLNGVNLFTGDAASTGSNYADLVNADRARSELLSRPSPEEDTFVEPLDFAGEIQKQVGLSPEERARIETRLARTNADILAENTPEEYRPIGGGFSFGGDIPIPRDTPEGATFMGDVSKLLAPFTAHAQRVGGFPALAEQGTTPALAEQGTPQSLAEPGSPQAIFERIRAKGALSPELIAAGQARAEAMGTTFDPEAGFSRDPFLQFQQAQQAQQAEREALANRPGYGYGGAVNDQYQSADFDTISQGVFDTPMTGMRPINAETGERLSQGVIDAAARAGLELPMGSVPLPQAPVNSVPMGRDATRAALGGRTLNQYLNAPDRTPGVSGLRTDPQGRMIPAGAPGTSQTRADVYGQYEDEVSQAYQRQSDQMQQLADQRDGTAGPRTYGGYTTAQLRGMVGGGDNLRAAQMRAEAGLNPVTGNRESTEEQNQLQTEVLKARLAKLKEQDPDKLSKAESYADRLKLQGDARTAFIFSQMGTAMDDVFGLEGTGAGGGGGSFTEAQQSSISKVMAANPGSSREQIIAEMKKQGKL